MPYPSAGPDPDIPLIARPYLDDGHLPSRGVLVAEPDMNTGDHAQAHENAFRAAMAVLTTVGNGWIPPPVGVTNLAPLTFTVGQVSAGLTGFTEFTVASTGDVSTFLSPSTKLRWGVGQYGVVAAVPTSTAFVVVGPVGQAAPAPSDVLNLMFSPMAQPVGFPVDPASWTAVVASPTSGGIASGNDNTVPTTNAWNVVSTPTMAIHLPGGFFDVAFAALCEGQRGSAGICLVAAGLSTAGNTAPQTDLYADADATLPSPGGSIVFRATLQRRASRSYASACPSPAVNLSLNIHDAATTTSFHIRHDIMESRISARLTLI